MTEVETIESLVRQISPILRGKGPAVQGAVLAELTSLWLAGHRPELRDTILALQVKTIKDLTKINAHA